MISVLHTGAGVVCLVLGAAVFLNRKATRAHRTVGTLYCLAMLALNVTALCIYRLTGRFNLFHLFAILSLAMVMMGWAQALFRRRLRNWFRRHYLYMCWSYAGLIAATSNEAFVRIAPLQALVRQTGNWVILAAQAGILGISAFIINRNRMRMQGRHG